MVTTGISGRGARPRTSIALAVAAALILTAGCASTVAGTARTAAEPPGIPTAPVTDGPRSSAPVTSVPVTTEPETTESETTEPETTGSETTGPETTGPETTESGTSEPQTTSLSTGVPGPVAGFLRKELGEDAGIADLDNKRFFTFRVTDIDPDFGQCRAGTPEAERGHLVGVRIEYEVLDAYSPTENGTILFDRRAFQIRDGANTVLDDLYSPAAEACVPEGDRSTPPLALQDTPLSAGDRGAGWVLLDAPSASGVVQLTQVSVGSGGWEWVIPGS